MPRSSQPWHADTGGELEEMFSVGRDLQGAFEWGVVKGSL